MTATPSCSNFEAKIASIRRRSEAEHLDCEIETRSAGSGGVLASKIC